MQGKYQNNIIVNDFGGNVDDYEKCVAKSLDCKPEGMSDSQQAIWDEICPLLFQEKRMKALFSHSLRKYCEILAEINFLFDDLKDNWTYETEGRNGIQIKNRPELARLTLFLKEWKPLVAQFGLTPGAEARFKSGQLSIPGLGEEWSEF